MKISIPNPCHVPLSDMQTCKRRVYCDSCAKNVVDFRSWNKEDIQTYFKQAAHQKTCGIFKKEDVKAPPVVIIVPEVDSSKLTFRQQFLYALLICFGTLFYSCGSNPSSTSYTKENITISHPYEDSLVQTPDSAQVEKIAMAEGFGDSLRTIILPNQEPTGESHTAGLPEVQYYPYTKPPLDSMTISSEALADMQENIFTGFTVFDEPTFPGGEKALAKFLKKNIHYPEYEKNNHIKGTVYAIFTIMEDGRVANAKIERSVENAPNFDAEVIRVIQLMPKWKNPKNNGKVYPYEYHLPIRFSL